MRRIIIRARHKNDEHPIWFAYFGPAAEKEADKKRRQLLADLDMTILEGSDR